MFFDLRCASCGILPQNFWQVDQCKREDPGLVFDCGLLHHGYLGYNLGLLAPRYDGGYIVRGVLGLRWEAWFIAALWVFG